MTGWNAVKTRVQQLGLSMTDEQVKTITAKIKALADIRPIAVDDADAIIRSFHLHVQEGREHEHDVHLLHGAVANGASTAAKDINGLNGVKKVVNGINGTGVHKVNGVHHSDETGEVNGG